MKEENFQNVEAAFLLFDWSSLVLAAQVMHIIRKLLIGNILEIGTGGALLAGDTLHFHTTNWHD